MIKYFEHEGRTYEIDTTPEKTSGGYKPLFAEVFALESSPASGTIAEFLRTLGEDPTWFVRCGISDQERAEVVKAAGWSFSRSEQWRELWERCGRGRAAERFPAELALEWALGIAPDYDRGQRG